MVISAPQKSLYCPSKKIYNKIMDFVNLNEFLAPQTKNLIMIIYNQEYFNQVFTNQADFAPLKGKWLFVEYQRHLLVDCLQFLQIESIMFNTKVLGVSISFNLENRLIRTLPQHSWRPMLPIAAANAT